MFDIQVCAGRRIALVQFRDLSEADFATLDRLGRERQGRDEYDVIYDLSAVDASALTTDFVSRRGTLPQAFQNRERLYVVPQEDLKLLVRLYAAYQQSGGSKPPIIVDTLEEAFRRLGVSAAEFQPVAPP